MEPSVEIYTPSRLYARVGWAALAGAIVCTLCGFRAPLAFIPGVLCALTAGGLFRLSALPHIRVGVTQFHIGERTIAWQEVREINSSRFVSPLILKLKLTNSRRRMLIFPGEPEQIARLMYQLRKNSTLATFDGVAHRDYWTWNDIKEQSGAPPTNNDNPVRMLSQNDEDEIERMYQKLKSVGHLDSRKADSSKDSDED
ncbi:MAG: hypothetical protein JO182_08940 [Acidobacteriaceae bacterium]|nr:hypothetical protein [Acidobacteriaceae bacterium]MBV9034606.1 hypothetical protein [Acidobacteriaceae bacterium]MBV9226717.1 hypothetical protein [Acidobacteriaceae bacterium]MBV9306540.1 hypothetical protein [Acidobacteriaceae bacterium]MBV9677435.1 hypothetical protein [Acidobacteriaceae bacterium]